MQRNTRVRNGIRQFPRNRRGSLIDSNLDGDGPTISLDESASLDLDINLNVFDFIPNEQSSLLSNKHLSTRPKISLSGLSPRKLVLLLSMLIVLWTTYAYGHVFLKNVAMFQASSYKIRAKNCTCIQNNRVHLMDIYSQIDHLNEKLQNLNDALDETVKWKDEMKVANTKTENLQENFNLMEQVGSKIENALNLYDADKVGMIDYALESAGGFITSIPNTVPYPDRFSYDILGVIAVQYPSNPRAVIQPGTLPGQCFAFVGQNGRIRIRLAHMVDITAVTIEHAHPNLISESSSAPKDFKVYGLEMDDSKSGDELGLFQYTLDEKPLQTFPMEKLRNKDKKSYQNVELHILTNHGNLEFTCVYRFRVHGNK